MPECKRHNIRYSVFEQTCPRCLAEPVIEIPDGLNRETADLVIRFASALAAKLYAAELKYGFDDGWKATDWQAELRTRLLEHLQKGDPRDVANYCAFAWHHGWSVAPHVAQAQPLNRPNAEGYWWTRPDPSCKWRIVEITICGGRPWIQEMGDDDADTLPDVPWWEWVGPVAEPLLQSEEFATTEAKRSDKSPGVVQSAELPEGPGRDGHKPLMRNRTANEEASPKCSTPGDPL